MNNDMDCKRMEDAMPDLLFDPGAAPAAARLHLAACQACQAEWGALQRTMSALGGWEAPEPGPFWTARMGARLRAEQESPRGGWAHWAERLKTRLWLSNRTLRPAAAGAAALGLVLAVGGGAWLDLSSGPPASPVAVQASNTVRDLQSLNENAQVFQQLSALDGPDTSSQGSD